MLFKKCTLCLLVLAMRKQRKVELTVGWKPSHSIRFQMHQGYTVRLCIKNKIKTKQNKQEQQRFHVFSFCYDFGHIALCCSLNSGLGTHWINILLSQELHVQKCFSLLLHASTSTQ